MKKIITLYHGSCYAFDSIDLARGKPFKDFSPGFYTSEDRKHAERLALRNRAIEISRFSRRNIRADVQAWLYTYEFDLESIAALNVKNFSAADREWMRFVVQNRTGNTRLHDYDLVFGPTANDNTSNAIQLFFAGAYGDIRTDRAIDMLIANIEPGNLPYQYYFGTEKSVRILKYLARETIT
jgi:hypothetical protein